MRSTWKRDVARNRPDTFAAFRVYSRRARFYVLANPFALNFFNLFYKCQVDAFWVINVTVGIAACDDLSAELLCFVDCIRGDVAGS
ncbi:hypothetical protein D3C84_1197700 [compost metagenome]